ncbi:glutamyl-tRNA amidotransferase [Mucilaginibacter sp. PPCGB 2223]|uniref:Asp-tRNA(Asn)/Glu-tRNA(Gln) amidotransferase subunit GatC n=1 Tax=Mucilaginibacter sp. PPCGB 2223 TaxID=1886027 RepID=UPI000826220B|nr:Asp-tRNA(Asn)/Glu-tRNA(Gln) amidotransferase subunit GatC [Mucilaginibacter sp. PPCGB 2223]OCX53452.1 glutamyl-tRNA amidotransferase [Mucilaginibacter sp. PPCGB 2223]
MNKETVDKIAHLARLEVTDAEREELIKDMENILGFMDKLNEIDTTGVEPLVYMTTTLSPLRPDVVRQEITHEQALENAPEHDDDHFRVAKVIG